MLRQYECEVRVCSYQPMQGCCAFLSQDPTAVCCRCNVCTQLCHVFSRFLRAAWPPWVLPRACHRLPSVLPTCTRFLHTLRIVCLFFETHNLKVDFVCMVHASMQPSQCLCIQAAPNAATGRCVLPYRNVAALHTTALPPRPSAGGTNSCGNRRCFRVRAAQSPGTLHTDPCDA